MRFRGAPPDHGAVHLVRFGKGCPAHAPGCPPWGLLAMATCTTHVSPVIYVPLGAPGLPSDEPDISSPHCVLIARLNPEFDTRGAHICFKIPMLLRFIVRFGRLTHEIHVRKGCRRIHFWPGREVVLSRRKPKICYHRTFPDVEYIPACGNVFCRCSSLELWAILTPVFSRSRRTVGGRRNSSC